MVQVPCDRSEQRVGRRFVVPGRSRRCQRPTLSGRNRSSCLDGQRREAKHRALGPRRHRVQIGLVGLNIAINKRHVASDRNQRLELAANLRPTDIETNRLRPATRRPTHKDARGVHRCGVVRNCNSINIRRYQRAITSGTTNGRIRRDARRSLNRSGRCRLWTTGSAALPSAFGYPSAAEGWGFLERCAAVVDEVIFGRLSVPINAGSALALVCRRGRIGECEKRSADGQHNEYN